MTINDIRPEIVFRINRHEKFAHDALVLGLLDSTYEVNETVLRQYRSLLDFIDSDKAETSNSTANLFGSHNGHDYVDLGIRLNGKKVLFATCNVGANKPEEYGDYFAWGETAKRYDSIEDGKVIGGNLMNYSTFPIILRVSFCTHWQVESNLLPLS